MRSFSFFKKKKQSLAVAGWVKVGEYFQSRQRQLADWLNGRVAKLPVVWTSFALLVICGLLAACSVYLVLRVMYS